MLVLGVIFTGVATPVEAAGIGTFGTFFVAAIHRRLTWRGTKEAAITTLKASSMVLWIIFGASIFVGFYSLSGGREFVAETLIATGFGPYGILLVMMVILVVLGMFLDWVGILLLAVPIFVPIMLRLKFEGLFGLPGPVDGLTDPQRIKKPCSSGSASSTWSTCRCRSSRRPSATRSSISRAWPRRTSPWR
ncbi:MAG: TRAP transporter large permease subunit [Alphaproteobacteria bacterium]